VSFFDDAYRGTPPWDISRPQRAIVVLEDRGEIAGSVIDVGCGTGENALFLAERGHDVLGVDGSPRAIAKARAKADERGSAGEFLVFDALDLASLGRAFDTAVDCGLFHTFTDEERPRFAQSMQAALEPGGRYFLLCFSEHEPGSFGPRRVTQEEIRVTFGEGWRVDAIDEAAFETHFDHPIRAWLAKLTRT
jgi:cyclopropane fatty-acyl-phospholipid synthase-like methyltransferase